MGRITTQENFIGYDSNGKKYLLAHFICDTLSDIPTYNQFANDGYIIAMGSTADIIAGLKKYQLQANGVWADITDNNGVYTLPAATVNSLGGVIVGNGLSIDNNGVLSASGGASMPYTNHNGGIRGENLGDTFTADQKTAIADGSFSGLYVGDYWQINGIKYYIIDIDYYYKYGYPTPQTQHHLIVFPDDVLSAQGYTVDNNFYGGTSICTTYLPAIATDLETIFGNYLVNQSIFIYKTGGALDWMQVKCILPSTTQMQGYLHNDQNAEWRAQQFSYFRYSNDIFAASERYWLRDSVNDFQCSFISPEGALGRKPNSNTYYLRPYFILSGTAQT